MTMNEPEYIPIPPPPRQARWLHIIVEGDEEVNPAMISRSKSKRAPGDNSDAPSQKDEPQAPSA